MINIMVDTRVYIRIDTKVNIMDGTMVYVRIDTLSNIRVDNRAINIIGEHKD